MCRARCCARCSQSQSWWARRISRRREATLPVAAVAHTSPDNAAAAAATAAAAACPVDPGLDGMAGGVGVGGGGKRETCMDQSVHFDLLESYPMSSMLLWARAASAGLVQASREGRRRRRRRRPPPPARRRWCSLDDDTRHPEVSVRSSTQPVAAPSHDRLQTPATWLARRHGSRRS